MPPRQRRREPLGTAPGGRRRLLRWYGLSLLPMVPAAWLVVRSPVFEETTTAVKLANFVTTLVPRSAVLVIPVALMLLLRPAHRRVWIGPAAFAVTAALLALSWRPLLLPEASRSLWRNPDRAMLRFLASPSFQPGATYRVLRVPDFKVGMYQMLRAGGRLDSEFFPESIVRRRWPSAAEYGEFLRRRHVDYVMIWGGYARVFHANDADRLTELEACRPAAPVCAHLIERDTPWTLWQITRQ